MATQPQFQRTKTYAGRRGRKKFEVVAIHSQYGNHTYDYIERPSGKRGQATEEQFLQLARLEKTGSKVYLSASQISTFRKCKRKWAFTYINGETSPPSLAMNYGTEVHAILERYLKTGLWAGADDAVACARQGEHLLPAPRDKALGIEKEFRINILGGKALFLGYIDLEIPPRASNALEISDHKTTKDMRYAETEADLKENVQANIYSKNALDEHKKDKVLVRWRYYCSRPSRAKSAVDGRPRNMGGFKAVTRVKTREEVEEQWKFLLLDAAEMVKLSTNLEMWAADIEGNEFACGDYGGCPFKGKCDAPQNSLGALMQHSKVAHTKKVEPGGRSTMGSLMDIINRNKKKKTEAVSEAPKEPEVQTATNEPVKAVEATEPPKKSALALAAETKLAERQEADGAQGVNPPPVEEVEVDPALTEAAEKPIPQTWIDRMKKGHKPRAEDEKAWRAKQEKVLDKATKAVVEAVVEAPTEPTPEVENPMKAVVKLAEEDGPVTEGGLFILFVDCLPAKGTNKLSGETTLSELLRPMKTAVEEMKKVPHWNLPKYNEGATLLAACTEKMFRVEKPVGIVLIDSYTPEWRACGDVLTELADVVVRGL